MSYGEDDPTGIPTRAIHETYLEMQRSLQSYRGARDAQRRREQQTAHGELQSAVLTFYELLRPHLKHESGVEDYWVGRLPSYNLDGVVPDIDEGKGLLQQQEHSEAVSFDQIDGNPREFETLKDWHDALGYETRRVSGVAAMGDAAIVTYLEYEKGLRNLDSWRTTFQTTQESRGGFMSHKTRETVQANRVGINRLVRAARELSAVADRLGALSDFDASNHRVEITDDQIRRVEQWADDNLS